MSQKLEKEISDLVGSFTDPIIVYPGGWGDTLPNWLKEVITIERLAMNMKSHKGEEPIGTDAECCAYLYTAAMTTPLDYDWSRIYLYIATRTYDGWKKVEMPDDVAVKSINDYQLMNLNRLKTWIYEKRCKIRRDNDRKSRKAKQSEGKLTNLFDFGNGKE